MSDRYFRPPYFHVISRLPDAESIVAHDAGRNLLRWLHFSNAKVPTISVNDPTNAWWKEMCLYAGIPTDRTRKDTRGSAALELLGWLTDEGLISPAFYRYGLCVPKARSLTRLNAAIRLLREHGPFVLAIHDHLRNYHFLNQDQDMLAEADECGIIFERNYPGSLVHYTNRARDGIDLVEANPGLVGLLGRE